MGGAETSHHDSGSRESTCRTMCCTKPSTLSRQGQPDATQIMAGQEEVPKGDAPKDMEEVDDTPGMEVELEGFGMEESEVKFQHTQAMEVAL